MCKIFCNYQDKIQAVYSAHPGDVVANSYMFSNPSITSLQFFLAFSLFLEDDSSKIILPK